MRTLLKRLSLRASLAAGFAFMIALVLIVGAVSAGNGFISRKAIDQLVERDGRISDLSLRSITSMFKARRREKDFLLTYREFGFDEARTRYLSPLRVELAELRSHLADMQALSQDPEILRRIDIVKTAVVQYEKNFLLTADLIGALGYVDSGVEGLMRKRAHDLEQLIFDHHQDQLMIDLLMLRRYEKDFLRRAREVDVVNFHRSALRFNADLKRSNASPSVKDDLRKLMEAYAAFFQSYVDIVDRIRIQKTGYQTELQIIEPKLEELYAYTSDRERSAAARVVEAADLTIRLAVILSVVALLFGAAVAWALSRSIAGAVGETMDFAARVARGDVTGRLARSGNDEFGRLASALNSMTDALQSSHDAAEQHGRELQTANAAMKGEVLDRRKAEKEVRELNVELEGRVQERTREVEASNDGLTQRNQEITTLSTMGHVLLSCLTVDEACGAVPKFCQELFPDSVGALYLLQPSRDNVECVSLWNAYASGASPLSEPMFPPQDCWALRRGQAHVVEQPAVDLVCTHMRAPGVETPPYLCVPMVSQIDMLGLLCVQFPRARTDPSDIVPISASQRTLAVTLAEQLALVFGNLRLRDTLRQQSIRDPLTLLFNRRYFEESLQHELARARRNGTSVGFVMMDVDHFKRFNDSFGHEAGDIVLREISALLLKQARTTDIACRYGGEELTLLMPDTSLEGARHCGEKLRAAIEALAPRDASGRPFGTVTISMGLAMFPQDADNAEALMKAADRALYQAKKAGRNRLVSNIA